MVQNPGKNVSAQLNSLVSLLTESKLHSKFGILSTPTILSPFGSCVVPTFLTGTVSPFGILTGRLVLRFIQVNRFSLQVICSVAPESIIQGLIKSTLLVVLALGLDFGLVNCA